MSRPSAVARPTLAAALVVVAVVAFALTSAGCTIFKRPLVAPKNDAATILLLTGGLGPPIEKVARHPWFAVRHAGDESWTIYEVGGNGGSLDDPFDNSPYVETVLHGVWRGAEAEAGIDCLERESSRWISQLDYRFFPGPNSNTFGDVMLRRCGLHAGLPSTAVGKDWRGWIGAGVTSEGTGVQVETPILGFKVGLKEGVEIHIIGLSFGVDFWPPALIVPFGDGRIGFADR